jgi:alpha-galactosidase
MNGPRIVLIGAGSASFGLGTLAGLMRTPSLRGATLVLVDLDAEGLRAIAALAGRLDGAWASGMRIESSTDRERALVGADFVVVSVASDREAAWQRDREAGRTVGIEHYAENGGPGGLFHAARSIGLVLPIAKDVERICPEAWLVVYTNPLPRVCRAIARETSVRVVGLCHQIRFGYMVAGVALRDALGLAMVPDDYRFEWTDASVALEHAIGEAARRRLEITAAGLNHFTWMLEVRDRESGKDWLPALRSALAERVHAGFEPLTRHLARATGYVPVSGDTHLSEYLPYAATAERFARYGIPHYDHDWSERRRQTARAEVTRLGSGAGSVEALRETASEGLEDLVDAMWHDTGAIQEAVNIPNPGAHLGLPAGAIVETPARASRSGLEPLALPALPEPIREWCRRETVLVDAVIDATLDPSESNVRRALLLDPMVHDLDAVDGLTRAVCRAERRG